MCQWAGGQAKAPVGRRPGQCASRLDARPMCQWIWGQANVPVGMRPGQCARGPKSRLGRQ